MLKSFFYDVDRYVQEESVILVSIFKWFMLSAVVGALVGISAFLFLESLDFATGSVSGISYFILLPAAFTLNMIIIKYVFPKDDAYTTNKVIQNVHSSRKITPIAGVKAFFIPIISIASGGSVGKEAPVADIGAAIGSTLASILKLQPGDWRKLSICGISAGFAAIFGTPIAGAIFGVELLFIGTMLYEMLLPCLVAGITGYAVATALGAHYIFHPILISPEFSTELLFKILVAGVLFGVCSLLVIEIIKYAREFTRLFKKYAWAKSIVGGLLLAFLASIFSARYLGLGNEMIAQALLSDGQIAPYAFLLKIVFTALTLASGGIGGIITPVLVIGSTAGHAIGNLLALDPVIFAAIGMVAVLAGTTNTPIAASILAIELFGPAIAPYAAVTCITSFLMTGHRSVYPGQILKIHKSPDMKMELGKTIEESQFSYEEEKSMMRQFKKMKSYMPDRGWMMVGPRKPKNTLEEEVEPAAMPGKGTDAPSKKPEEKQSMLINSRPEEDESAPEEKTGKAQEEREELRTR
ncbi:chloride channel protein [Candidatus Woesearchaeota archaeon]|nr:chloride channel protein [Candidatus Woesearchaeota archaeon]